MCGLARGAARGARTPPAPPRPLLEALTRAGPPHRARAQLDYSRCSDLSDSVGYWYVEDRNDGWCRVFYSTDSQLPRFIPGFAKDMLTNMAAKRSTSWVALRCNQLTGSSEGGAVGRKGKALGRLLFKALLLAAAAWQLQLRTLGASHRDAA